MQEGDNVAFSEGTAFVCTIYANAIKDNSTRGSIFSSKISPLFSSLLLPHECFSSLRGFDALGIYLHTLIKNTKDKFRATYDPNLDTFRSEYLLVGSFVLALLFHHKFGVTEILWTFSIYLESVAILPQLFMLTRTGEAETITTHYLFALGAYRALYLLNWIYRYKTEGHVEYITWAAGLLQTALYSDFFYIYYSKVLHGKKFKLPHGVALKFRRQTFRITPNVTHHRFYGTKGYGSVTQPEAMPSASQSPSEHADQRQPPSNNVSGNSANKGRESEESSKGPIVGQERDPDDVPTPYDSQAPTASESTEPSKVFDPDQQRFVPVDEERYHVIYTYQPLSTLDHFEHTPPKANEFIRPIDNAERSNQKRKNQSSFDRLFLCRLFRIARVLFSSTNPEGNIFWVFMIFIGISCVKEITVYYAGTVPSRFFVALVGQDWETFKSVVALSLAIVLGGALGNSMVKYMGGVFALAIRRILTSYLHHHYVHPKTFYRLLTNLTDIDNPDQRITQDIDKFSQTLRDIFEHILISPILITYYTYKCWAVSGYMGPLLIYIYFIVGTIVTHFFIAPIVNLVFRKEYYEGNFRYLHVRIRQFAESIAFSRGEHAEAQRLDSYLQYLLCYQRRIIDKELSLQVITESFSYFGSVLSYLIIAVPIFNKKYEGIGKDELSGIISLNAFFSMYLIYRFTIIVQQSVKLSDLAGYTARIGQICEAVADINQNLKDPDNEAAFEESFSLDNGKLSIAFQQVSICSPNGNLLLSDLDLIIEQGKSTIIFGPNGSGKTSIFRVLCNLWPPMKGHLMFSCNNARQRTLLFLPQTPYLCFGSLRDQITYPLLNFDKVTLTVTSNLKLNYYITPYNALDEATDEEIRRYLGMANLLHIENVVKNFDAQYGEDWDKILTPGEQQKLAFARLFFWKPVFAALDEATSALDPETEYLFFETCKELGITCITISHNKNLLRYHKKLLLLDGKGRYATTDIENSNSNDTEMWIEERSTLNNK
ncbi:hypothetical protein G9A89_014990 [Geosiphon pyriformis]|nr:hypothetical protein G9A89_014990 [Geosiphon pyriformis]